MSTHFPGMHLENPMLQVCITFRENLEPHPPPRVLRIKTWFVKCQMLGSGVSVIARYIIHNKCYLIHGYISLTCACTSIISSGNHMYIEFTVKVFCALAIFRKCGHHTPFISQKCLTHGLPDLSPYKSMHSRECVHQQHFSDP